ncbi:hypothetical protein H0E87_004251, partial [Populus deltoides]
MPAPEETNSKEAVTSQEMPHAIVMLRLILLVVGEEALSQSQHIFKCFGASLVFSLFQ